MENGDTLKKVKGGIELIGEVIKAAGDDPNVKAAAGELGKSAYTLTKAVNNLLLPIAAINFGFEKARIYFETKFESDLSEKAKLIPPERLVEPKASIAGPALQGLAFSHEEEGLKEMYLQLLKSSMDSDHASSVHPAFVEIIRQLSVEETQILNLILTLGTQPIVEIRKKGEEKRSWNLLLRHVLPLQDEVTSKPIEIPELPTMVDNWIRLKLVDVEYSKSLAAPKAYDWVENRPEFIRLKTEYSNDKDSVYFEKGSLIVTSFGLQFARIVGALH